MDEDYKKQHWVTIYHEALLELQQAAMAGRIGDARDAIARRLEVLREIPGLHGEERIAIEDALTGLRMLEREDERAKANEQRIAQEALAKLRGVAAAIQSLNSDGEQ